MSIRTMQYKDSMDHLWDELIYTKARLEADPKAKDLAPSLAALADQVLTVRQNQRKTWASEIVAQAHVDMVDYELDECVFELGRELGMIVKNDRKNPRWLRYFGQNTPYRISSMKLASELGRISSWSSSLQSETEASLIVLGQKLSNWVVVGQEALGMREKAYAACADHRAREIKSLIDEINNMRLSLYGELMSRAAKQNLNKNWPYEFFRKKSGKPRKKAVVNDGVSEVKETPSTKTPLEVPDSSLSAMDRAAAGAF